MLDAAYYAARGLSSIYKKILNRKRLDFDDGMTLFALPGYYGAWVVGA